MDGYNGPSFGKNDMMLAESMNTFNNGIKQGGVYLLPNPTLITGSQNTHFQCSEVEVYRVMFE
jgi:hypothetical protein